MPRPLGIYVKERDIELMILSFSMIKIRVSAFRVVDAER